ncbi:MAG: UDP-N-acetylmuramate--alanine ligase, partial [Erysipelotrichaceae bacterium]|nr:UDP-N-acetylmuramate--alanine ligase [Erysipelotrichaceae bacterium]
MYYFIGIKGTGMASLAVMLHDLGNEVCGSDQPKHFFTEDELVKRNITILPFDENNIKPEYTVIIGNAFLEDFPEVIRARKLCRCYRYHEFLGELMKNYKSISICGSHGKTTTTTMAKTVVGRFKNTGYLIGDGEGYLSKDSEYLCVESDEFRRHFISYYPEYAIITNIEIDHVDYFKD